MPRTVSSAAAAPAASVEDPPADANEEDGETDPLGPNGACYVCHIPFVMEELAKTHLAAQISCAKCHGLSGAHANDENVGATKPDITFSREQIDAGCKECHKTHNVPAGDVVARFAERKLSPAVTAVCTDCHGTHKIEEAAEIEAAGP